MIGIAFGSNWSLIILLRSEEALKAGSIGAGMMMSVLKLVYVANIGKVFAIAWNILFQFSDSLENSFIRFINLHKLQL